MSISELLVPNHFNLTNNSIYIGDSFSNFPTLNQTLSTVATTQLLIDNVAISPLYFGHLTLTPTTYTAQTTGVFHFGGSVAIHYVTTANDFVKQSISIIVNGITSKYVSVDQRSCLAGSSSIVSLPLNCYIALNVGDVVTVRSEIPVSNIGAGNLTTNEMLAIGTMWYGCRG